MLREEIDRIVQAAGKHYQVTVSIGCSREIPNPAGVASIQSEAELFLSNADRAMYLEKQSIRE